MKLNRKSIITGICIASGAALFVVCGCERPQSRINPTPSTHETSQKAEPSHALKVAPSIDETFEAVLKAIVDDDGLVRYNVLAQPEHATALESVREYHGVNPIPNDLPHRKAWLCNAYNVNVLAMVLKHREQADFNSVNDVPGFFDEAEIRVGGESTTLERLHMHIRELGDPRVHGAVVQAAMSSPHLRNEPYQAARLDEQLDQQCRRWVDDSLRNAVTVGRIKVSQVFDRYAKDFEVEPYKGVPGFLRRHSHPNGMIRSFFKNVPEPRLVFMEFNWRLNQSLETAAPPSTGSDE